MLKICSGFPGQHLVGGSVWKAERVEGHEWRQIVGAEPIYIYKNRVWAAYVAWTEEFGGIRRARLEWGHPGMGRPLKCTRSAMPRLVGRSGSGIEERGPSPKVFGDIMF